MEKPLNCSTQTMSQSQTFPASAELAGPGSMPLLENNSLELSGLLAKKDEEIEQLKKQLAKTERLLDKANNYNEDLRKEISILSGKIHNERKHKPNDVSTQVTDALIEEAYGNKPMPNWSNVSSENVSSLSIADTVKATIEAELQALSGAHDTGTMCDNVTAEHLEETSEYIYDSTSGLYYHPATGYYWDPSSSLFYDYTTGTYYQYDEQTKQYNVYSVIDTSGQAQLDPSKTSNDSVIKTHKGKLGLVNKMVKKYKMRKRRKRLKTSSSVTSKSISKEDVIMISDSEDSSSLQQNKENNLKDRNGLDMGKDSLDNENILHSDESSGSLATGESELESGELTDDSSCSDMTNEQADVVMTSEQTELEIILDPITEIAENHPPCIRVIVESSEHLPLGSLYIITCSGGSIGREKNMGHTIEIYDSNVSKLHAEITYDYDNSCYTLVDKGSQNGTFLNTKRLSASKSVSESHKLAHGDLVEMGSTKLLLHIHKGHETCEDCEPGLVQAKLKAQNPIKNDYIVLSKEEKDRQRKAQLKSIKKKYGLQNSHFENKGVTPSGSDYCDKAYLRRKYIGSENDATKQDDAPASVQSPITAVNKGHRLLSKMGWKEGEGLGKTNSGIAQPVYVEMRLNQSAGLGSASDISMSLDNVQNVSKAKRWTKAQQRFHQSDAMVAGVQQPTSGQGHHQPSTTSCSHSASQISSSPNSSQKAQDPQPSSLYNKALSNTRQMSWVHGGTENIGHNEQLNAPCPADGENNTGHIEQLNAPCPADGENNIVPSGS